MMRKFAIILSGCGQHDGSETHEVVLTLLALANENISWEAFAPDILSPRVVNHLNEKEDEETPRHVLKEASRLVRGKISPLAEAKPEDYDAIIFPGGFGAVSILCDWATRGTDFQFHSDLQTFINKIKHLKKPMGFICIAPLLATKIYKSAKVTIGKDAEIAQQIKELGCEHIECCADNVVIDEKNKLVSTPANMVANHIGEVYEGISKLVKQLNAMT